MECSEQGYAYGPLDLAGHAETLTKNVAECQARCLRTEECKHFSYWQSYGHCHLQGEHATRGKQASYISGPRSCELDSASRLYSLSDLPHTRGSASAAVALPILSLAVAISGIAIFLQRRRIQRLGAGDKIDVYSVCTSLEDGEETAQTRQLFRGGRDE